MLSPVTVRLLEPREPLARPPPLRRGAAGAGYDPPPSLSGFRRPITETEKELQRPAAETTGRGNANGHPTVTNCHRAAAGRGGSPSRSRAQRHKHRAAPPERRRRRRSRPQGPGRPSGPSARQAKRFQSCGSPVIIPGRRGRAAAPRCSALRSSLGAAPLTAAGRFLPSSVEGRAVTSGEGGALSRKEARGRFAKQRPDRTGEGCSVPRGVLTPAPGAERPGRGRDECWELCRQRPQQRGCPRPGRARRRQGRFTLSAVRGSWKLGRDPVFSGIYVSFCADSHFLPLPAHQHPFSPFRHTTPIPAAALFFTSEPGSSHERSGACVHPHSSRNSYCYLKLTSLSLLIYTVLSRGGFGVFFFLPPTAQHRHPVVKTGIASARQMDSRENGLSVTSETRGKYFRTQPAKQIQKLKFLLEPCTSRDGYRPPLGCFT